MEAPISEAYGSVWYVTLSAGVTNQGERETARRSRVGQFDSAFHEWWASPRPPSDQEYVCLPASRSTSALVGRLGLEVVHKRGAKGGQRGLRKLEGVHYELTSSAAPPNPNQGPGLG
jgi:hypothetical protein